MKIMSVDYGDARTGLAVCDSGETLCSPLCVIKEKNAAKLAAAIAAAAEREGARLLVVGLPKNMDGSEGARAEKSRALAEKLKKALPEEIKIELYDERLTTMEAARYMNETGTFGKKRKNTIDAAAAAIILEGFLQRRRAREAKG
ncbi:MAG: Holliday junction resolvase RuvX [Oscillospiraceae bacterium]|nr:Holliday junction resolvase RuvX [Oscillospiraceae bacterium]